MEIAMLVGKIGALSACTRLWQFPGSGASRHGMRRVLPAAAAAFTLIAASPAPPPVPGGLIGTLDLGRYSCELPGVAGGPVQIPAKEFDFTVVRGSSYRAQGLRGSYLLAGDVVTMTGGKLKGLKLHRIAGGFLRRVEANGTDGEMRCVRGTVGNS